MNQLLEKAVDILERTGASCVVLRPGAEDYISDGKGIGPLMDALAADENALKGAAIADKVVGKAIAMVAIHGGAAAIYGQVLSQNAVSALEVAGMEHSWGRLVDYIQNRAKTGCCPMEASMVGIYDPEEAFPLLRRRLDQMRQGL